MHNAEMLRRWLVSKHAPNLDGAAWREAISSPECRRTDKYLNRVVREMEYWQPDAYDTLQRVYLGRDADPAKGDRWRKEVADSRPAKWRKRHAARMRLHYLEDALRFVVVLNAYYEEVTLHWPAPEDFTNRTAPETGSRDSRGPGGGGCSGGSVLLGLVAHLA